MAETAAAAALTQIGAVFVTVTDQDKAIDFYTSKLGFELRADVAYGDGDRWVEVGLPDGQSTIALVIPPEGSDSKPGGMHCALHTADIDATHADFKAKGVDVDDIMRMPDPVPPMFFFRDQDGNSLLIVEPNM